MSEISFGSTFRIPITQQGINKSKKVQLKSLIDSYGGLVGTGNTGYARVSIGNDKDAAFLRKLKGIGYRVFQQFQGENIAKKNLDRYIKNCLDNRDYKQFGKQKAKPRGFISKPQSQDYQPKPIVEENNNKIELINRVSPEEQDIIRKTKDYQDIASKYGQDFADAAFFLERK